MKLSINLSRKINSNHLITNQCFFIQTINFNKKL
ncbi:unnamed protein product [Acanthoscelides obtectus]|uniref:Uncharacterized protein n=1 Tax=Acanthoscelides obtectus TaxID=200917 RepID=A0A9P0KS83_ACAOB|nr:unnamed protein product [Acanthoscelides obtectus]CAK1656104.1 hypothetical protein AOBTE_LOCUS19572 [Acanthoscelides obtectus]